MTREQDRRLSALRDVAAPGESQAEERGWHVVREAFAERQPTPRRLGSRARGALALAAAGLVGAFALTPAGADVRDWIADAVGIGEEDARPVIGSLPAPGSVLVESGEGAWIINDDGSRRRLGAYDRATWSPNGLFVGAAEGRELFALTPQGEVRWTLTADRRIRALDWSADEGFRLAYLSGRELRVVAGDSTGDSSLADPVGSSALAWRPEALSGEARHELAFIDRADRVVLADTDSGRTLWRSAPVPAPVSSLQWSADGSRLLIEAEGFATLLGADGEGLFKGPIATGTAVTLAPDGLQLAVVRPGRGGSELALLPAEPGGHGAQVLYPAAQGAGGGSFGKPTFSPDGEWILLPWPEADQWLFIRVADRRVIAVADISRQLDVDRQGTAAFPQVAGWCC